MQRLDLLRNRLLSIGLIAGLIGGFLISGLILAALAGSGWLRSPAKTVTIEEAPVMPIATADTEQTRGLTVHQVYEQDAPGVVLVRSGGVSAPPTTPELIKGEGNEQGTSNGSGFEVDDEGTILTNAHVVENTAEVTVLLGEHSRPLRARVLGEDPASDIAVLRIPTNGLTLHPLTLGSATTVVVGEPILAIGNPFGYTRTLTTGVISALGRQIEAPSGGEIHGVLQTDAPLDPGSSGGPLLNAKGQVVGINSQIVSAAGGGGDVGISFAIPIGLAERELAKMRRG